MKLAGVQNLKLQDKKPMPENLSDDGPSVLPWQPIVAALERILKSRKDETQDGKQSEQDLKRRKEKRNGFHIYLDFLF